MISSSSSTTCRFFTSRLTMASSDTRLLARPTNRSSTVLNDKLFSILSNRFSVIIEGSSFCFLNSSSSICCPILMDSFRSISSCFCRKERILFRACPLLTILIQSSLGPFEFLLVRMSTTSPVFNIVFKGTMAPFTLAPTVLCPTSVCMRYAKSIGHDPCGKAITFPLGDRQ